jgi:hypothetical protein
MSVLGFLYLADVLQNEGKDSIFERHSFCGSVRTGTHEQSQVSSAIALLVQANVHGESEDKTS